MSTIDEGGSAFPVAYEAKSDGMTLRDYFAGHAMQSLLSCNEHRGAENGSGAEFLAKGAYIVADAMIEARKPR